MEMLWFWPVAEFRYPPRGCARPQRLGIPTSPWRSAMHELWFWLVAVMFAIYVVLWDGFDFGAGILHLVVAETNEERREVLGAIGPFWDGNEVSAAGGRGVAVPGFPQGDGGGVLRLLLGHLACGLEPDAARHLHRVPFPCAGWPLAPLLGRHLRPFQPAAAGAAGRGPGQCVARCAARCYRLLQRSPVDGFRIGPNPAFLIGSPLPSACSLWRRSVAAHGSLFLAWKTKVPCTKGPRRCP